eukprot:m.71621 g.71621  ORF g.71621 m.71621 type:complete len:494 (-) comp12268_c0_seq2:3335-4816(-)
MAAVPRLGLEKIGRVPQQRAVTRVDKPAVTKVAAPKASAQPPKPHVVEPQKPKVRQIPKSTPKITSAPPSDKLSLSIANSPRKTKSTPIRGARPGQIGAKAASRQFPPTWKVEAMKQSNTKKQSTTSKGPKLVKEKVHVDSGLKHHLRRVSAAKSKIDTRAPDAMTKSPKGSLAGKQKYNVTRKFSQCNDYKEDASSETSYSTPRTTLRDNMNLGILCSIDGVFLEITGDESVEGNYNYDGEGSFLHENRKITVGKGIKSLIERDGDIVALVDKNRCQFWFVYNTETFEILFEIVGHNAKSSRLPPSHGWVSSDPEVAECQIVVLCQIKREHDLIDGINTIQGGTFAKTLTFPLSTSEHQEDLKHMNQTQRKGKTVTFSNETKFTEDFLESDGSSEYSEEEEQHLELSTVDQDLSIPNENDYVSFQMKAMDRAVELKLNNPNSLRTLFQQHIQEELQEKKEHKRSDGTLRQPLDPVRMNQDIENLLKQMSFDN